MARARRKGALIISVRSLCERTLMQFLKKQKQIHMATINQKVDHLNKLTMIAMTSEDAYMHTANQEVCEFISSLTRWKRYGKSAKKRGFNHKCALTL